MLEACMIRANRDVLEPALLFMGEQILRITLASGAPGACGDRDN